jgi:hypothetical protein
MPSDAYRKYYEANRDTITARMRERDAVRREERRKYLEENPDEVEGEREKMRNKYHNWRHNTIKRKIVVAAEVRPDMKPIWDAYLKDDLYKTMKPAFVKWLDEVIEKGAEKEKE